MHDLRQAMAAAGMLATEGEPIWEQPASEGIPVISEVVDGAERHFMDEDSPEFRFWEEACLYRIEGSSGIAWWKVCSDDWWIVTAEECDEALAAWKSLTAERRESILTEFLEGDDPYWHELLGHVRLGAEGNGFRVL